MAGVRSQSQIRKASPWNDQSTIARHHHHAAHEHEELRHVGQQHGLHSAKTV